LISCDELCIARQYGGPEATHRIAVMIDLYDLLQIVWPVSTAMRTIPQWPARWRLTLRKHGGNRREKIAPVKAG
jgi:hypothetical protein